MTHEKHTPGPWRLKIEREGTRSGFFIDHDIDSEDGYTVLASYGEVSDTDEANARLIAAAPELLEACKKAMTCGLDSSVRQLVQAAIAKAEGR